MTRPEHSVYTWKEIVVRLDEVERMAFLEVAVMAREIGDQLPTSEIGAAHHWYEFADRLEARAKNLR